MRTAKQIRSLYLTISKENESKFVVDELLDLYDKGRPCPKFTNNDDFSNAVERVLWFAQRNRAVEVFWDTEECELTPFSRWSIEQAMINRPSGVSMFSAGMEVINKHECA